MRRLLVALAGTAGGVAVLLSVRLPSVTHRSALAGTTRPGGSGEPGTTVPPPAGAPAGTRRADGSAEDTPYGPVQVRVTVSGGRLVDVSALRLPDDREGSVRRSDAAGPILRSEALSAQNADIDVVSGATYTSEAYARSLQAALDAAHG